MNHKGLKSEAMHVHIRNYLAEQSRVQSADTLSIHIYYLYISNIALKNVGDMNYLLIHPS